MMTVFLNLAALDWLVGVGGTGNSVGVLWLSMTLRVFTWSLGYLFQFRYNVPEIMIHEVLYVLLEYEIVSCLTLIYCVVL